MGRRIRSTLPQVLHNLIPKWRYLKKLEEQDRQYKRKQKRNYDKRHWVRSLADIPDDQPVWVDTDGQQHGRIVTNTEAPRSYLVDVPSGRVRRNRQQLIPISEHSSTLQSTPITTTTGSCMTRTDPIRTRSPTGTKITPPDRLTNTHT